MYKIFGDSLTKMSSFQKHAAIWAVTALIMAAGVFGLTIKSEAHDFPRDHVHIKDVSTVEKVIPLLPPNTPIFVGETKEEYKPLKLPLKDYTLPPGAYIEPAAEDVKAGIIPVSIHFVKDKGGSAFGWMGDKLSSAKQGFAEKWSQEATLAEDAKERDDQEAALDEGKPIPTPMPSPSQVVPQ
jgi:hypothetical protein